MNNEVNNRLDHLEMMFENMQDEVKALREMFVRHLKGESICEILKEQERNVRK